jgi:predicted Zn-dependent protease
VETYPEASDVFDSLDDAYRALGDIVQARENYMKALALDASDEAAKEGLQKSGQH